MLPGMCPLGTTGLGFRVNLWQHPCRLLGPSMPKAAAMARLPHMHACHGHTLGPPAHCC